MLTLNFNPFPILFTKRLCLRRIKEADAPAFFALRTNEQLMKYIDRPRPASIADIDKLIQKIDGNVNGKLGIMWGITTIDNDELIGTWISQDLL